MDEPSVAVLGLPGFGLLEVREIDGELEYLVETIDTLVGCPTCGTLAKAKDRREVVLRDLAHGLLAGRSPPAPHHSGESRDLPPGGPGERVGGAVRPELRRGLARRLGGRRGRGDPAGRRPRPPGRHPGRRARRDHVPP